MHIFNMILILHNSNKEIRKRSTGAGQDGTKKQKNEVTAVEQGQL